MANEFVAVEKGFESLLRKVITLLQQCNNNEGTITLGKIRVQADSGHVGSLVTFFKVFNDVFVLIY